MKVLGRLLAPVVVTVVTIAAVMVGGAWWLGGRHALQNLNIREVSADMAARAMQDDHFYSDFGDKVWSTGRWHPLPARARVRRSSFRPTRHSPSTV